VAEQSPFFSVILPTYNRSELLPKAIESVLSQTYADWELIIVDDASTDNTALVVKGYSDSRIRYLLNEQNIERSASRNRGIDQANGTYICFLDSDDYYLENHLESFNKCIENNDSAEALYYCNTYEETQGKLIEIPNGSIKTSNKVEQIITDIIGIPRTCIHQVILKEFRFNPKYRIGEDMDLWVRIVKKYPLIPNHVHSVVYLNHVGRSVQLNNRYSFVEHINRLKQIISEDREKHISSEIKKTVLADAYYNLGRHYEFIGGKSKAIFYLTYSLFIFPSYHWKKKLYMILNNCALTHWLLTLNTGFNK